jgi:hypothetical protein
MPSSFRFREPEILAIEREIRRQERKESREQLCDAIVWIGLTILFWTFLLY